MSCKRCWRPHQKIFFLARVMNFWKSRFACNYTTRETFKSRYPKVCLMYLLERTTSPKVLKLGLCLPRVDIYKSGLWICEILLFSDFMDWKLQKNVKNPIWPTIFRSFQPIKSEKSKISKVASDRELSKLSDDTIQYGILLHTVCTYNDFCH